MQPDTFVGQCDVVQEFWHTPPLPVLTLVEADVVAASVEVVVPVAVPVAVVTDVVVVEDFDVELVVLLPPAPLVAL
jgi:hypothetical protein